MVEAFLLLLFKPFVLLFVRSSYFTYTLHNACLRESFIRN